VKDAALALVEEAPPDGYRLIPTKRRFVELYVSDPDIAGNATKCFFKVNDHLDPSDPRVYANGSVYASLWLREPEVDRYRRALLDKGTRKVRGKIQHAADRAVTILLSVMEGDIRSRLQMDAAVKVLELNGIVPIQRTEHDIGDRLDNLIKEIAARRNGNNGTREIRSNAETGQDSPVSIPVEVGEGWTTDNEKRTEELAVDGRSGEKLFVEAGSGVRTEEVSEKLSVETRSGLVRASQGLSQNTDPTPKEAPDAS